MIKTEENQKKVLTSAIIAKATLRRNGRYEFIIVFQNSTRHEFYWIFQAKNRRSPRRSWKYAGHYGRDFDTAFKAYSDFGSFIEYYTRVRPAEVLAMRVHQARRLAAMLAKVEFETIHSDWTPQIDRSLMKFDLVEKVNRSKFRRTRAW